MLKWSIPAVHKGYSIKILQAHCCGPVRASSIAIPIPLIEVRGRGQGLVTFGTNNITFAPNEEGNKIKLLCWRHVMSYVNCNVVMR